jgi:hypothetical protein
MKEPSFDEEHETPNLDFYEPNNEPESAQIKHKKIVFWFIVICVKLLMGILTWHYVSPYIKALFR